MTATWKCLISRFVEDVNTRQRLLFSFLELWYCVLEFNSRKICCCLSSLCTHHLTTPSLQLGEITKINRLSICALFSDFSFAGYSTHLVGKWHLGFYKWPYVPTKRGFDTAYGFWDGAEDHFDHSRDGVVDFRDNLEPVFDLNGTYATNAYVDVSKT